MSGMVWKNRILFGIFGEFGGGLESGLDCEG